MSFNRFINDDRGGGGGFASSKIATITARSAQDSANDAKTKIGYMEKKIEKLLIITEALWEITKKSTNLTDDDLYDMMNDIDLRDGVLDGKVAKEAPTLCTQCNRNLQKGQSRCIYCGTVNEVDPFKR